MSQFQQSHSIKILINTNFFTFNLDSITTNCSGNTDAYFS